MHILTNKQYNDLIDKIERAESLIIRTSNVLNYSEEIINYCKNVIDFNEDLVKDIKKLVEIVREIARKNSNYICMIDEDKRYIEKLENLCAEFASSKTEKQ